MGNVDISLSGSKEIKKYLAKTEKSLITHSLLEELGNFMDVRVQTRTLKGKNANEGQMGEYSPWAKKARDALGLQTDHIDLFFTGSMFAAQTHKVAGNDVTSFFESTKDRKGNDNPEKAARLDSRFNFFSLSANDADAILDKIKRHVSETISHGRK